MTEHDLISMSGIFYCGDNLEVLDDLRLIPDESVDLIYMDPPFNSRRSYNIVYKDSRAQELAFKDYWTWEEAAPLYARIVDSLDAPPRLRALLRGLHELLKDDDSDLLAYLSMMSPRIVALHRVLKPTGTLYLHCDPTASHYLKAILDAVFGSMRFLNEVIWKRTNAHNSAKRFGPAHDVLLYYSKGDSPRHNPVFVDYSATYKKKFGKTDELTGRQFQDVTLSGSGVRSGESGRKWRGHDPTARNRHWAISAAVYASYKEATGDDLKRHPFLQRLDRLDEAGLLYWPKKSRGGLPRYKFFLEDGDGVALQDVWTDIEPINSQAEERIGYPTQKPISLLARIVAASSREGDLVLDPFCGCGTTVEACERMGRRWIGIDISHKAVDVTHDRFERLGLDEPTIEWVPPDMAAAGALAKQSGLKFEAWALRKVGAAKRRKRDRGIDGEAFFKDAAGNVTHALVSVKSGKLNPSMVRDLRGTVEREGTPLGAFVCLKEPSREMRREAVQAGYWRGPDGEQYPRLQFLTVAQIFAGATLAGPGANITELPRPNVPTGRPRKYEQLSLRLSPTKPLAKAADASAPVRRTKRAAG